MPVDSTPIQNSKLLSRETYFASFIPLILLVLVFGAHFVQGVSGSQEMREIVGVLGLGGTVTAILVFFAGVHDGTVTVLLLAKGKLFPNLPWWTVFLYAGIWPIVPRALIWFGGGSFEWIEVLIFAALAGLAFLTHTWRSKFEISD